MNSTPNWQDATNILCIRLDSIGDVLMTTPALRALKASVPGRRITLLTSPSGAEVAGLVPEIDEVLVYESPWMKATAPRENSEPEYWMATRLHAGQFDAAAIFTVYSQSPLPAAFLCYLADIPLRLAHCHENPYQLLTHWVPDPEPNQHIRHEVRRQLDLVASVGCRTEDEHLSLRVPSSARMQARALLEENGLDLEQPWVLIHPGATAPSRRYSSENFAEVGRHLVVDYGLPVVLVGGDADREQVTSIHQGMRAPAHLLPPPQNISLLAALIESAPVLISNNSGPAHIAAAVGTPVVDLYALTNPQHQPWLVPNRVLFHDVPCKYCYKSICPEGHHNCLRLVEPEQVVQAALELLDERVSVVANLEVAA